VPRLGPARALVWAALAAAALAPLRPPAAGPPLAVVTGPSGCRLAAAGDAPACPCGSWGAGLRRVLGLPLPLDRANSADLATLPGIGAARAAAIVAEREANGPFASPEALERVPGIGPVTAARLVPLLFTGPDDPACAAAGVDPG